MKLQWSGCAGYPLTHCQRVDVPGVGQYEVRKGKRHYGIFLNGGRTNYWADSMWVAKDTVQRLVARALEESK